MNKHRIALFTLLITACIGSVDNAHAQLATFDVVNYAENLQQVLQLTQQLQNMEKQLDQAKNIANQAKSTYDSTVGSRGMGGLVTDSNRGYMSGLNSGSAEITSLANSIKTQAGYLSTKDLSSINSAYRDQLVRNGDTAANAQAMNTAVFNHSGDQFQEIQTLMDRIDTANDPKAIADLQARIQAEQAMLAVQATQAQALNASLQAQERVSRQQSMQRAASQNVNYYNPGQ